MTGFELVLPCPFPTTITITPRAPPVMLVNSLLNLIYQVQLLAMLDHPNIISYYDSFEEDGILMIEMEYADGG